MQKTYFAASNSGQGFASYYGELFTPAHFPRIYLIKGGPGTGKSSLMRRVAEAAEAVGLEVRRYLCSSDPTSIDAVTVEGRFALLDATAPHAQNAVLPGAVDQLVDLGQFWDEGRLSARRDEIAALDARKVSAYARAYRWIAAVAACRRNTLAMLEPCADLPKLRRAAERFCAELTRGSGLVRPALVESIGMRGRVCIDSMRRDADAVWRLSETRGGGDLFLREVYALCRDRAVDLDAAWCAAEPELLSGMLFPRDRIAILDESVDPTPEEDDHSINMSRFWIPARLREVRTELRHAEKCRRDLLHGVELAFADARDAHFALEKIYSATMDFTALDAFAEQLTERILA